MQDAEILAALQTIFRNVFDNDAMELTRNTHADDIDGWDSMANITLAVEVEDRFGVKFKTSEMEDLRSVDDLVKLVQFHLQPHLIQT